LVKPWADVAVDGKRAGQTPLPRFPLRPGAHSVVLSHPDYRPYQRTVRIRSGEAFKLEVDLTSLGVPRAR
jgi:hypothetical protein